MYAVYLTIYGGNSMPPLYIGSSSIEKIKNGYRGSVGSTEYKSTWLYELKNAPELFGCFIIKEFEDRNDALGYERLLQLKYDVINNPLYINKGIGPESNAKFICNSGELNGFYGHKHTEETINIQSSLKLGSKNPMFGRTGNNCPNGALVGEDNPMFGLEHSDESLELMRNSKNANNPLWKHKDTLYNIWIEYNRPSHTKCKSLFVSKGYNSYDCRSIHRYFKRKEA